MLHKQRFPSQPFLTKDSHMRFLTSLLAAAALTCPTFAQDVTFRGKVEDVSGTTNQFVLDCTNTKLTSVAVDLNLFIGQMVEITGPGNGSSATPEVLVNTIAVTPETFEIGGGAKIGETSTLGFTGAPGDLALGFISLGVSFQPLPGAGVIFLDQSKIVVNRSGIVGPTGILQLPLAIPNNPALIGLDIYGQGALIGGGFLQLTNPDCKTIDS